MKIITHLRSLIVSNPEVHDGWNIAAQAAFLSELNRTGVVAHAAAVAGLSASSAYRFRRRPAGAAFARAWDAAKAATYDRMLQIALLRIDEGVETDIVYRGEVTGKRQVISDRMLMFMLRHLKPDAAAAAGAGDPAEAFAVALEQAIQWQPAPACADPVPVVPAPVPTAEPVPTSVPVSASARMSQGVERLIGAALAATRVDPVPVVAGVNRREPVRARVLAGTIAATGHPLIAGVTLCEPAGAGASA